MNFYIFILYYIVQINGNIMKNNENLFEALTNPNSNFRREMNSWWGEYINNKENNKKPEEKTNESR